MLMYGGFPTTRSNFALQVEEYSRKSAAIIVTLGERIRSLMACTFSWYNSTPTILSTELDLEKSRMNLPSPALGSKIDFIGLTAALDHDDLRVFIQTADAGGGRSTARHTAYDHNFHLAPSTMAAISDLGR